ncbi:MAG: NAD-dependent DNA ligase LigA [Defluviitaleaceae bacterium]|nr:NAD-dependent DNA ligase LigA [Defluviitaleaceae bacterium]
MAELIEILTRADRAYEQENQPIMSDFEYDKLYDELLALEARTGIVLENSPTSRVGHEVVSSLAKVRHDGVMLSLDKTKDVGKLATFLNSDDDPRIGVLSWKLDGLSIVLKYAGGRLVQALTRGNGEIGEDVTHNARFFRNIPSAIDFIGNLSVRGEAIITFTEFERINEELDEGERYKNPRNLCSGTIRQLNTRIAASRKVEFYPFAIMDGPDFAKKSQGLVFLKELGFDVAEYRLVNEANVAEEVEYFKNAVAAQDFATDGLVLTYDDIDFSRELGATSKFPRDSLAFKWADELKTTRLLDILWNTSRTGLINPIAIFSSVDIEGTTVERASLHNISILEGLALGVGDEISVYKANMIIPQIAENFTKSGAVPPPKNCPVCQSHTTVKEENDTKTLHCTNPNCRARVVRTITHYASRSAMNIEGFSLQTVEKFCEIGWLSNFGDIYQLTEREQEIKAMRGFGEKSFAKMMEAIEKSKTAGLANFIYALGIDNVGLAGAKALCRHFGYDFEKIRGADTEEIVGIEGFGEIIAHSLCDYFRNAENRRIIDATLTYLTFHKENTPETPENSSIFGKTFVITGDVAHYTNRKELQEHIESLGGKVAGSVSKKTDYLINNDAASPSAKNKKAQELGVAIITEAEFVELI